MPSISPISSNHPTAKKAVTIGAVSSLAGGLVAYGLQKSAINTTKAKAEAKGFKRIINFFTSIPSRISNFAMTKYAQYKVKMNEIAQSGKISKKGIAKTAIGAGIAVTALYLIKNALSKKDED